MLDLLREFLGQPPTYQSIYDIPQLLEWLTGAGLFFLVAASIYAIFGNIISIFRR